MQEKICEEHSFGFCLYELTNVKCPHLHVKNKIDYIPESCRMVLRNLERKIANHKKLLLEDFKKIDHLFEGQINYQLLRLRGRMKITEKHWGICNVCGSIMAKKTCKHILHEKYLLFRKIMDNYGNSDRTI